MKKHEIPKEWLPWIEIVRNYMAVDFAVKAAKETSEEAAKLVALCLSAAKWITGRPEDLGIETHEVCGVCRAWDCRECPIGFHVPVCISNARDGLAMRLYAEALAEWDRQHEHA